MQITHRRSYCVAAALSIKINKTKTMVFAKYPNQLNFKIKDEAVEQVKTFKYLSTTFKETCDIKREIRARIEQAGQILNMKNLFTKSELKSWIHGYI